MQSMWPAITEALARKDFDWITGMYRKQVKWNLILAAAVLLVRTVIGRPLIRIWAGAEAVPPFATVVWIALWNLILAYLSIAGTLLQATNHITGLTFYGSITAILNIALSILLVHPFGISGVIAATVIAYTVSSLARWSLRVERCSVLSPISTLQKAMSDTLYSEEFFRSCSEGSLGSAKRIVPYLKTITNCQSVIDVGCGLGIWLSVFNECGVADFVALMEWDVNQETLLIPQNRFIGADLTSPPKIDRTFDLAICLEVAEHLPLIAGEALIDFLTSLSPVIAFSASIPHQDGTGHINEHWLEYWIEQFSSRGYVAIDCIRPLFWDDPSVQCEYLQNTIVYVNKAELTKYPELQKLHDSERGKPQSRVHPRLFLYKQSRITGMPVVEAWKRALERTLQAVRRRLFKTKRPTG